MYTWICSSKATGVCSIRKKMTAADGDLTFTYKSGILAGADSFLAEITDRINSRVSSNAAVLGSRIQLLASN
jgi:hypothetical protein